MTLTTQIIADSQEAGSAQCTCEKPCRCLPPYSVHVKVITRLGGFPIQGAKVVIIDKTQKTEPTEGSLTKKLTFPTFAKIGKDKCGETDNAGSFADESMTAKLIEIWVSYENEAEKVKEEVAKVFIKGPLLPTCAALDNLPAGSNVMNQIWKVQDVQGDTNDINFFEQSNFIVDSDPPLDPIGPHSATEQVKHLVEDTGAQKNDTIMKKSRIKATYDPDAGMARRLFLEVTVVMDTFSLMAPYLSQNMGSVVLFTYPASTTARPANHSPLFGYPTLRETSIVSGSNQASRTAATNMANEFWPIDDTERDYVHDQVRSRLPNAATIETLNNRIEQLNQVPVEDQNVAHHTLRMTLETQLTALLNVDTATLRGLLGCRPAHTRPNPTHTAACTNTYLPHLRAGSDLCFPTSVTMLLLYHGYTSDNIPRLRAELLRKTYENATAAFSNWGTAVPKMYNDTASDDKPWQTNGPEMQNTITHYINDQSLPGRSPVASTADNFIPTLAKGLPLVVSVGGHIVLMRGAVVGKDGNYKWAICNDPQGTLAGPDSNYNSPTSFTTGENEINAYGLGDGPDKTRGRHVYYKNGGTHRVAGGRTTIAFANRIYITTDAANEIDVQENLSPGIPKNVFQGILYDRLELPKQPWEPEEPMYA